MNIYSNTPLSRPYFLEGWAPLESHETRDILWSNWMATSHGSLPPSPQNGGFSKGNPLISGKLWVKYYLGGDFKYFLCSPLLGEDFHFD